MTTSNILIRAIERLDEVRSVEELQKEAWGMTDRDIVPLTELVAVRDSGGQLIGAYDGPVLAGFVYGFVAMERGETTHHSHLLAVLPAYRGGDIGYRLKLAQRERVLAQGIRRITWTFDPLQSLNAYFNFCKLGVTSDCYKADLYGGQSSSFLHQSGTDRLWVSWLLESDRVRRRLQSGPVSPEKALPRLLRVDEEGAPCRLDLAPGNAPDRVGIEIPAELNALAQQNPSSALRWRESSRGAFTDALGAGFVVDGFVRAEGGRAAVYTLSRRPSEEESG